MFKHITTALVINFLVQPCFAMDDDQKDFCPPLSAAPHDLNFQEILLEKKIIWPGFKTTLNHPTTYQELFETHQLFQARSHSSRKFALENAWRGDQIALKEVIAQGWYKKSQLFELTDLIVRMAQLNSPVAQNLLNDYQKIFKSHEIWRVLDIIITQVNKENSVGLRVLEALICHSHLEEYAFPEHFATILKFIIDKSQDKDHPHFVLQEKLLEAYANGHYGIKKFYSRNKRFAREQMLHFALKDQNPKAQMFLLKAYHEGLFGFNSKSKIRLMEAREYLKQFSTTTDTDLNKLVNQASVENWYGKLSGSKNNTTLSSPSNRSSARTSPTPSHFDQRLIQEISEHLKQVVLKKKKAPLDVLENKMHKIEVTGFNGINYGMKKNRKLALKALKELAENDHFLPAQTFLIHIYYDGLFGIKKANRTRQKEALDYLNAFAYGGNHHVQMLQLYALTEGWFNVDPTEKLVQRKALNLARQYAFHGNKMAQVFLIDTYQQGKLGTKLDPKRHFIALELKEKFDYYPGLYETNHRNYNIFLALSD